MEQLGRLFRLIYRKVAFLSALKWRISDLNKSDIIFEGKSPSLNLHK